MFMNPIVFTDMENNEGYRQTTEIYQGKITAKHIKLTIVTGHDHFVAIYHLEVISNDKKKV